MASTAGAPPPASPSLPWKTRFKLWLLIRLTETARRSDNTVNRCFLRFFSFEAPPTPTPINGVVSSDVTVDPTRNIWFRIFTPTASATSSTPLPVIVYFHGGGFAFLSPAFKPYDLLCRRFAESVPAVVISVNYRLSPEHRFPTQYEDGFDVLKYIDEHCATILPRNADVIRCFLAGDSAGGNLAHHVAVQTCRSKLERITVKGLISIQPFFGGTARTESEVRIVPAYLVSVPMIDWCWKMFLPEGEDRDHWAVNVTGPNAVDIAGLDEFPGAVVFTSGFDALRDQHFRYYERLKRSGKEVDLVDYPDAIHAFYFFSELPETGRLVMDVKDFVSKRLAL